MGTLKIALLLCPVTKPLTPAPCARCVSGKERREEAPAQREGGGWQGLGRAACLSPEFQRAPALAAGSGVTAIAPRCQRQQRLFAGFQAAF